MLRRVYLVMAILFALVTIVSGVCWAFGINLTLIDRKFSDRGVPSMRLCELSNRRLSCYWIGLAPSYQNRELEFIHENGELVIGFGTMSTSRMSWKDENGTPMYENYRVVALQIPLWLWTPVMAVFTGAFFVGYRRQRRRLFKSATNRCVQCEYDLTGNESGTCPECGTAITQTINAEVAG